MELHVDVHDGARPPALMVHGIMAGRGLWAANIEALRTVCTPVVVELWGHGRSPTPTNGDAYTRVAYADAFDEIRRSLGVARWSVIGHSLGAALVLNYAFDHPDEVIAQVFTNSASALGGPSWRAKIEASAADDAARLEAAGRAGLATNKLNPALSRRVVDEVRRELVADMDRLDPAGIAHAFRSTTPGTSIRERIMGNTRPTLLVAGEREASFDEGCDHASKAPHVEMHRVHAGHSPNAETPDVFNALVVDFLARHTS